jgi:IclR family transcriptional regulator, KDG regulon repressor
MKNKSYSPATTVAKAFKILELIGERQPVRAVEIARELKLHRSNAHRLLSTLTELGYAECAKNAGFSLTFKMFTLGCTVPMRVQLTDVAHPYMIHLNEISQENINLAVRYNDKTLIVDKVESSHYVKLDQPVGRTEPLYCTALGKVLLSGMNSQEFELFLKTARLAPYTPHTIVDPLKLTMAIKDIRKKGYAVDLGELSREVHCISAPIRDHTNTIAAALSISSLSIRLTNKKIEEFKKPLIEIAKEISKKIGATLYS